MTKTEKILIASVMILAILVAISVLSTMNFYFDTKIQSDSTSTTNTNDVTSEEKTNKVI